MLLQQHEYVTEACRNKGLAELILLIIYQSRISGSCWNVQLSISAEPSALCHSYTGQARPQAQITFLKVIYEVSSNKSELTVLLVKSIPRQKVFYLQYLLLSPLCLLFPSTILAC